MRARTGLGVALVLALAGGAVAVAGDDPAVRVGGLARDLLAPLPAVRERAERDLAAAPPEDLRALVRLYRDRLRPHETSPERDSFVGADVPPQQRRPEGATRGLLFEVRWLDLDPDLAAKWLGAPTGTSRFVAAAVPRANAERLLARRADGTSRAVSAGSMGAFDGQYVRSEIANHLSYVADYVLKGTDPTTADPVIGSLSDGLYLGLRGRRRPDGVFHVEVDARGARIERPLADYDLPVGGKVGTVRIQVPTTTAFRSRTATDVGEGGSFLVGDLGPSLQPGGVVAALVTVGTYDFTKPGPHPPLIPLR